MPAATLDLAFLTSDLPMTSRSEILTIPNGLGSHHSLQISRFGIPGGRPRVYMQAGLHTEELPGPLVLCHLRGLLTEIPSDDWRGEVIIVPFANPIGLSQAISGNPIGRMELASGMNFNTGWPSRPAGIAEEAGEWLHNATAVTGLGGTRLALLRAAEGADVVLDLHCCMEPSVAFAFIMEGQEAEATRLAGAMGLDALFAFPPFEGGSFMGAAREIAAETLIATIELRGYQDIEESRIEQDALGLEAYLRAIGVLASRGGETAGWKGICTSYDDALALPAPLGGIFRPRARIRDIVQEGDVIGDILLPVSTEGKDRVEILSPCRSMILSFADPAKILHPGASSHVILPLAPLPAPPPKYFDVPDDWA